jgi:hypothetical protein
LNFQPGAPSIAQLRSSIDIFVDRTLVWIGKVRHVGYKDGKPIDSETIRQEIEKVLNQYEEGVIGIEDKLTESDELTEARTVSFLLDMQLDDAYSQIKKVDEEFKFDRDTDTRTPDGKKWTLPKGFIKMYVEGDKKLSSNFGNKFISKFKLLHEE